MRRISPISLKWVYGIGIFMVVSIAGVCYAALTGALDEKSILERIKPVGEITVEAGGQVVPQKTVATGDIGKQKYEEVCHTCHATGLAGAPKLGDKADWAPRINEGMDILVKHAIEGYKTMPPKGTCTNCSDEEIKKAVQYMVSQSK